MVWGMGDGHGLRTHRVGDMVVGGLNCWENWVPTVRHALYAQGEELHVAGWPGSVGLTEDITRFIAREGRCYVLSAGALLTEGSKVLGVRTVPSGLDRDGNEMSNYMPPADIVAKVTALAEGTRGMLAQAYLEWQGVGSHNMCKGKRKPHE